MEIKISVVMLISKCLIGSNLTSYLVAEDVAESINLGGGPF